MLPYIRLDPSEMEKPPRCPWASAEPLLTYHDEEWGRPVTDERGLFERLCLEAFQSGLSWTTILRKREAFRRAFADFEPDAVARFDGSEIERLLGDASIVRNRAKIEAAIANARATVALRGMGATLPDLVWSFRPAPTPAPAMLTDVPATTAESTALAKELKRRGFRFIGPTTVHALMEACGVVNDHVDACFVREEVAAQQARAATEIGRSRP
jgi:DNA-3-methyladenine glycosylase I